MVQTNAVRAWLRKMGAVQVSEEWLQACLDWIAEENQGRELPYQELGAMVYQQWLLSDLHELQTPVLPPEVATATKFQLQGSFALQVDSVVDAGTPYYAQLQKVQGKENANSEVSAEPANQNQQWQPKASRMLVLRLTDGCVKVTGMEYRPIPALTPNMAPGCKILVRGSVQCRLGVLMLTRDLVTVLGGEVDSLVQTNTQEFLLKAAIQENLSNQGHAQKKEFSGQFTARPGDDSFGLKGSKSSTATGSKKMKQEVVELDDEFEEDMDFEALMALDEMEAQATGQPVRSGGQGPGNGGHGNQGQGNTAPSNHVNNMAGPSNAAGGNHSRGQNSASSRPHLEKLKRGLSQSASLEPWKGGSYPGSAIRSSSGTAQTGQNYRQPSNRARASGGLSSAGNNHQSVGAFAEPDDDDWLMAEEIFANDAAAFSTSATTGTSSASSRMMPAMTPGSSGQKKPVQFISPDEEDLLLQEELFADDDVFDDVPDFSNKSSTNMSGPSRGNVKTDGLVQQSKSGDSAIASRSGKVKPAGSLFPQNRGQQGTPSFASPREFRPVVKTETPHRSPLFSGKPPGLSTPNQQGKPKAKSPLGSKLSMKKTPTVRQQTLDSMFSASATLSSPRASNPVKQEVGLGGGERVSSTSSAGSGGSRETPKAVIHPYLASPGRGSSGGGGGDGGGDGGNVRSSQDSSEPLTYLTLVIGQGAPAPGTTFTVKAYISTLTSRLDYSGGHWRISCKINDGSASLDVSLSNGVLTELIGFSAQDATEMKQRAKTDPAVRDVLAEGIQGCQQQLIGLSCLMDVEVEVQGCTVKAIRRPSAQLVVQLQRSVDDFLAIIR